LLGFRQIWIDVIRAGKEQKILQQRAAKILLQGRADHIRQGSINRRNTEHRPEPRNQPVKISCRFPANAANGGKALYHGLFRQKENGLTSRTKTLVATKAAGPTDGRTFTGR
jgi:hypothetical protein